MMGSNPQNSQLSKFFELGFSFMMMATSTIILKYIDIPPPVAILYRFLCATIVTYLLILVSKKSIKISRSLFSKILLPSILLAFHWTTFYYSLVFSGLAISVIIQSAAPTITTVLEAIIYKQKLSKISFFTSIMVVIGIFFIIPTTDTGNDNVVLGILVGIASAFAFSLRNIVSKGIIKSKGMLYTTFYQYIIGFICMIPFHFFFDYSFTSQTYLGLAGLVLISTVLGHSLFVGTLSVFSASFIMISSGSVPLIAMFYNYLFYDVIPSEKVFIGAFIILAAVSFNALLGRSKNEKNL